MIKAAKRPRGRPAKFNEPRMTVSCRLQAAYYDDVKAVASQHGRSISEEIERRLDRFAEWEKQFGDVRKLMDHATATAQAAAKGEIERALREAGYQRVRIDQGSIWADPGVNIARMSFSVDAAVIVRAMEPNLIEALTQALEKAKRESL